MTDTTDSATASSVIRLPLRCLRESPSNPRRRHSELSLQELTESIKAVGVMSPIIARPISGQTEIEVTHEIVFGHRRFRASLRAGKEDIPALVRDMSDAEAAVAQIHENLHREDVHALEEADAFSALMRDYGMSVEQIIADSGKSRSYVYGRLKLSTLGPAVRQACLESGLGAEIALLLARLPHHKLQEEALKLLRSGADWISYRAAKGQMARYLVNVGVLARFDLAATDLPGGACSACPKLAANDPDLHELDPTACVDRACFDAKAQAHVDNVIDAARTNGRRVVTGEAARAMTHPYLHDVLTSADRLTDTAFHRLDDAGVDAVVTWRTAIDEIHATQPGLPLCTLLVHPERPTDPVWIVTPSEQQEILRLLGVSDDNDDPPPQAPAIESHGGDDSAPPARAPLQGGGGKDSGLTEEEKAACAATTWRSALTAIWARLLATPRTADDLRMIVSSMWRTADDVDVGSAALGLSGGMSDHEHMEALRALSPDQVGALAVMCSIELGLGNQSCYTPTTATKRVALARTYGVDLLALAGQEQQTDEAGRPAGGAPSAAAPTGDLFGGSAAEEDQADEPAVPVDLCPGHHRAPMRYRDPMTGMTWSGRGLKPKWLAVALESGRALADFEVVGEQPKEAEQ